MATGKRILVVDDDDLFRQTLCEQVRLHEEMVPIEANTGADALEKAKSENFDVIVLDVGLPDIDGREVCRLMRRNGVASPIIILTGASSSADVILALDAGADDYVTKPFHIGILLARIRAHIRQYERRADAVFTIGPFTFKSADRRLVDDETNENIQLTEKETDILKCLCRAKDRTVKRDVLLAEVWGYSAAAETHTLDTHIHRLRKKIEIDPAHPRILIAERGGYRLVR